MSVVYKVWAQIEICDDDNDSYDNVGEPDCLGSFTTSRAAWRFFRALKEITGTQTDDNNGNPRPRQKRCFKCRRTINSPVLAPGENEKCARCADPE